MARNKNKQQEAKPESMSVREAGQLGGEKTAQTHGREFYEEIGHKGGQKGGQRVRELIEEGKEAEAESTPRPKKNN
jgi:general stress protein YciG